MFYIRLRRQKFISQLSVGSYDPTIEDSYHKQAVIDGKSCLLGVLDTTGQEEYTALRDQWIRDGDGFVLVYSITSRSSFRRIQRFHNQVQRVKETGGDNLNPPVMLVGHGYFDKYELQRRDREVSFQEGKALAKDLGCDFAEVSAEDCINVEKVFFDVVRALRKQRASRMAWHSFLSKQTSN